MPSDQVVISADNHGPWVNIEVWILMVIMIIASFVKLICKWVTISNFALDDVYLVIAMLLTIVYNVTMSFQVTGGLGRHQTVLSDNDIMKFQKAAYASQFFLLMSLGTAKMVLLQFFLNLGHRDIRKQVVRGVMGFTAMTYTMLLLPVAFQCPTPNSWEILSSKCFNQAGFWTAFTIIDILTDLCTVALPIYLLYDIRLKRSQKIYTISAFSTRALIIPLSIARIIYIRKYAESPDHTYDDFAETMITSLLVNTSIIITAVPFLKPVMDSLQTGILTGDLRSMSGQAIMRSTSFPLGPVGKNIQGKGEQPNAWKMSKGLGHSVTAVSAADDPHRRVNSGSDGSTERMVILQESTVSVQYEGSS